MRKHWHNAITHFDDDAGEFISSYFSEEHRRCLLVAAAGFDPRSGRFAGMLADVLGDRLTALFIREDRGQAADNLVDAANAHEAKLRELVPGATVTHIEIFAEDGAAIGGSRIATYLAGYEIDPGVTDIVLDMSALSIGVGFPAAKMLLEDCEAARTRAFHIVIMSNPELDDRITSEPAALAMPVKGFQGLATGELPEARIWIPQLARGRTTALSGIGVSVGECYKICPVLPFPARDPRRADSLLAEYETQLVSEWQVDPRDLVYVSERNPLDCFRTLSTLKERYYRTVEGTYEPQVILSPIGSKVMAAGALMAAIEYDLTVQYLETVRYEFDGSASSGDGPPDMMVHVLLSGPAYGDYDAVESIEPQ